jgi:O-methyltransferase
MPLLIRRAVEKAALLLGIHLHSDPDEAFPELLDVVRDRTMVTREGLASLYEQVRICEQRGISGSFVECGVWKGGSVGMMALANLRFGGERRHLHLFDSFEGLPEPDAAVDGAKALREIEASAHGSGTQGRLIPLKGVYDRRGGPGTVDDNRTLLEQTVGYDPAFVHFHKGWFQETLPADAESVGPIAILRIDADWYASTKVCLEFLFPRVMSGGFVIVDDYGTYEGCRKAVDEFLEAQDRPLSLNRVNDEIVYMVAP